MRVLLVHGIFMPGWIMSVLAHRLRVCGHETLIYSYGVLPKKTEVKGQFVRIARGWKPDAIIGHSTGGIIAIRNLHKIPTVTHVVCLGSPLLGSAVAKKVTASKIGFLFSAVVKQLLLEERSRQVPSSVATGMIAGTSSRFGLNLLFPVLSGTHDGSVGVEETCAPYIQSHIELPVGHTSMLFSKEVASCVITFLRQGKF
jgi:alpha-beta hydrolase superfamily lysophospholipase